MGFWTLQVAFFCCCLRGDECQGYPDRFYRSAVKRKKKKSYKILPFIRAQSLKQQNTIAGAPTQRTFAVSYSKSIPESHLEETCCSHSDFNAKIESKRRAKCTCELAGQGSRFTVLFYSCLGLKKLAKTSAHRLGKLRLSAFRICKAWNCGIRYSREKLVFK